jgi:hypothetical protein
MPVRDNSILKLWVVPFTLHVLVTIVGEADYKSKKGEILSPEAIGIKFFI